MSGNFFDSLRFDHIGCSMLFWIPTDLVTDLSHFWVFEIAEKMRMNPVLVSLLVHRLNKIDWSSSAGSDDFVP